jgi:transcriptional regulator with XRE-family HTH domain
MEQRVLETSSGNVGNDKTLASWLEDRCRKEHLSLREAAARADVSHTTIAEILNGARPSAETISKLAKAFAGDGRHQREALEDLLLTLSGYRSNRTEGELREPLARLMDKLSQLSDAQLEIMEHFADFVTKVK